ncbi:MAG: transcriptional repressor LexA [Actinomycetota bacterium]
MFIGPERVFDAGGEHPYAGGMARTPSPRRRPSRSAGRARRPAPRTSSGRSPGAGAPRQDDAGQPVLNDRLRGILECIERNMRDRGYPPSVREIGEAVGLSSSATVHNHLHTLQALGYLRRDPTKPRALEVRWEAASGVAMERRPVKHVPLVGDVAAGTDVLAQENIEELVPLPMDFTGDGDLFMLRVRGRSMIDAGILDGDFVVCRSQQRADNGDVVVAGIPGDEATVKTFRQRGERVTLLPSNPTMSPMEFDASEVRVYGKVVTVLRRLGR